MQERLRAVGLRPINNIVDATNFVAHEMGQPLHAFDLDRLCAAAGTDRAVGIVVRRAHARERLRTLDGVERELQSDDMVVCAGDVAVSLAGVMGGADTAVDDGTRNVLLEGATWHGPMIRATSRRLALRSDASTLFEKGLSDTLPPTAVSRAARLIGQSGGGHVLAGDVDAWPRPLDPIIPVVVTSDHISSSGTAVCRARCPAVAWCRRQRHRRRSPTTRSAPPAPVRGSTRRSRTPSSRVSSLHALQGWVARAHRSRCRIHSQRTGP
jgi:phenylalanyl-tRNA synthetase beta subunit